MLYHSTQLCENSLRPYRRGNSVELLTGTKGFSIFVQELLRSYSLREAALLNCNFFFHSAAFCGLSQAS